tara:strand:- start:2160 stop:2366 length:207 start_codon:yes stop_codon:yes gene_type:complete
MCSPVNQLLDFVKQVLVDIERELKSRHQVAVSTFLEEATVIVAIEGCDRALRQDLVLNFRRKYAVDGA